MFQKEEEFDIALNWFVEKNIRAWVNCPRRLFNIYQKIKNEIIDEDIITMTVFGGEWGLACNAIHYIDFV